MNSIGGSLRVEIFPFSFHQGESDKSEKMAEKRTFRWARRKKRRRLRYKYNSRIAVEGDNATLA
jgi:hypothetical protein